jgi:hypothetical protein
LLVKLFLLRLESDVCFSDSLIYYAGFHETFYTPDVLFFKGTVVLTEWYVLLFKGTVVLTVWYVLFWQCGMFCSDSVVCFVLTVWYVLFWQCGMLFWRCGMLIQKQKIPHCQNNTVRTTLSEQHCQNNTVRTTYHTVRTTYHTQNKTYHTIRTTLSEQHILCQFFLFIFYC